MADEYIITGSFANKSINHFKPYVKRGALDVEAVIEAEGLNEKQIPGLEKELIAAGYMKEPEPDLESLKKAELIQEAEKRGVEVDPKATKAEIIETIEGK
jgi:hypothetical protein